MKFLLAAVNAKYIHSNPAIYSLRAFARSSVCGDMAEQVELAEYTINQYTHEILADIYRRKPDVIGFSCYIWNWETVQALLPELPKVLPGVKLWLGGPEVSFDGPDILRQYPQLSGIMVGEGEETFRELLTYYSGAMSGTEAAGPGGNGAEAVALWQDRKLTDIPGLCLPTGFTAPRELTNMSQIPFLYEKEYSAEGEVGMASFSNRIVYYESSRGCPYRCSYCLSSIDKRVRLRDTETVCRELQFFLDRRVPQVKFVDRTFNCDHAHAMAIWQYLLEHDNGVTNFHFEISADILREEELALLQKLRPGLVQLEIGVQSVNSKTLEAISRRMDIERLEAVVARIRAGRNIHQHLDLIAGLPYEDYESFGRSFDRVYAMKPNQLQLGFLKVLKGSPMHEQTSEYGICYLDRPPYEVLSTKWLSYGELLRLKQVEEMVELYYNSGQFTHTLPYLERLFVSPFAFFEALADFYENEGRSVQSSSRAYRYQALLAFAGQYDSAGLPLYRELLTYDMYLREKLKSRPDFAEEWTEPKVKESIREFYQREEKERRFLPGYEGFDWHQLGRMTHLEPFRYAVWEENGAEERASEGLYYVLFDYRDRNPLTREAACYVVKRPGEQQGEKR